MAAARPESLQGRTSGLGRVPLGHNAPD
jgi:hypothetical protein